MQTGFRADCTNRKLNQKDSPFRHRPRSPLTLTPNLNFLNGCILARSHRHTTKPITSPRIAWEIRPRAYGRFLRGTLSRPSTRRFCGAGALLRKAEGYNSRLICEAGWGTNRPRITRPPGVGSRALATSSEIEQWSASLKLKRCVPFWRPQLTSCASSRHNPCTRQSILLLSEQSGMAASVTRKHIF